MLFSDIFVLEDWQISGLGRFHLLSCNQVGELTPGEKLVGWFYWGLMLRSYHGSWWRTCVSWLSHTSTNTIFFQSHRLLFSHASAEVKGENMPEKNFASTRSRTHNHLVMSLTHHWATRVGSPEEKIDRKWLMSWIRKVNQRRGSNF